ncbi:PIN domain-containing protein [Pseudactinotalea sp. HY160]|uniref:type II toxin-antitoxin system VapC family toxin n=1 Tax=Pseudactinotalea sp. HY160 TaxID=2654490 RepID=UPI00128C9D24|nr:PIN domain-containing protein [Pseudactinotalea sp. HY160]
MTSLIDTSILIDVLRGEPAAVTLLRTERGLGPLHASEVTRVEVLVGVRRGEERSTSDLLVILDWHPVDREVSERAGELGRRWLPSHRGIDTADLVIAATAELLGARVFTRNVKHFPMIDGLTAPY